MCLDLLGADDQLGQRANLYAVTVNDDLCNVVARGNLKHGFHHDILHDGTKTARAGITLDGKLCDCFERIIGQCQLDVVHIKELNVLLQQCRLWLLDDTKQRILVKIIQRNNDGKSADQLGDQTVLDNIVGCDVTVNAAVAPSFISTSVLTAPDTPM